MYKYIDGYTFALCFSALLHMPPHPRLEFAKTTKYIINTRSNQHDNLKKEIERGENKTGRLFHCI